MKTNLSIRKFLFISAVAVFISLSFSSCKKDSKEDEVVKPHLIVNFSSYYGVDHIHAGHVFTKDGRNINFNRVDYYISNFTLMKDDGTMKKFDGQNLLAKMGNANSIDLGEIDPGHYHMLKFQVGLDSATNHTDPTTYETANPLAPQSPSMHWSWDSGYIFMAVEGELDTTATPDGTLDDILEYHIGSDAYYSPVEVTLHMDAPAGSNFEVNVVADLEILLADIVLPGEAQSHTMDNMPVANKIKAKIASAFSKE